MLPSCSPGRAQVWWGRRSADGNACVQCKGPDGSDRKGPTFYLYLPANQGTLQTALVLPAGCRTNSRLYGAPQGACRQVFLSSVVQQQQQNFHSRRLHEGTSKGGGNKHAATIFSPCPRSRQQQAADPTAGWIPGIATISIRLTSSQQRICEAELGIVRPDLVCRSHTHA